MTNRVLEDDTLKIVCGCIEKDFNEELILEAINKYHEKRFDYFSSLNIENVSDDVFKNFVLYAVMNGYSMDEFIELVEVKIFRRFENLYNQLCMSKRECSHV